MSNRYEDYAFFADNIPFVLHQNVKRNGSARGYDANWHENFELQICNEGEGMVFIDGCEFAFSPNESIAVNSGLTHYTETESTLRFSCIIIDSQFCRDAGIDIIDLKIDTKIHDDEIAAIFAKLCATYNEAPNLTRIARLRKYTLELVIRLCEYHHVPEEATRQSGRRNGKHGGHGTQMASRETVKAAINYMREHFHEKITLDGMANALFANKYTLSRQFKSIVGVTVFEYLSSYRCHRASLLIASGESIKSAALSCGFENISFFTKTFKRYMGKKPSEFKHK